MCQLLGVCASGPVRLRIAWGRFVARGSVAGANPDGWGVAYFDGDDALLYRSPAPAAQSVAAGFLGSHGPPSGLVISHVRRATRGGVALRNTQPFLRRVGGRAHAFAHNGFVGNADCLPGADPWLQPVGETDSEYFFLSLLARILPLWRRGHPPLADRLAAVGEVAAAFCSRGAANFLYSDGLTLFAHGHRRTLPGEAISTDPGLYWRRVDEVELGDAGLVGPCLELAPQRGRCGAALIATAPLDDGEWTALRAGEIACFEGGERVEP